MKNTILILWALLPITAFCQDTKLVKTTDKKKSITEEYHVLASDKATRQGAYVKYDITGAHILEKGFYKNGEKDSLWTDYQFPGTDVVTEGVFKMGKRIGMWTFYRNKDTVEQIYNFSEHKMLFYFKDNSRKYAVINGKDTADAQLTKPPMYIGGRNLINLLVNENLQYPDNAWQDKKEGTVLVALVVNQEGKAGKGWIKKGVNKALDEEALRVVNLLPDTWLPGMFNGIPVNTIYEIPVTFRLQ